MISQRTELPIVAFSVRVYQILLVAYPTKFQQEYGSEMIQVFQDCCLRALHQSGANGMVKLWTVTLLDLIQSVISEHRQKEIKMKREMKPEDIRRSGWALILGAVSLLLIPWWSSVMSSLVVFVSLPLLAFGVLGLRHRYGEKVGSFGRNILLIGAILGPLTSLIGFFLPRAGLFWFITWTGPAVLFTCFTLFGVVALNTRPLPRWNILPIIAGLSYPRFWFSSILNSGWARVETWRLTGHWYVIPGIPGIVPEDVAWILLLIQLIALAALGYILKSDVPEQTAAPA